MIKFTIYGVDVVGQSGNCLYSNKYEITDKDSFLMATQMDWYYVKISDNLNVRSHHCLYVSFC